jgi:CSLREA domain-containing protein
MITATRLFLALATGVVVFLLPRPAAAQFTITVTTSADEFDAAPNASCSLREAIQSANTTVAFGGCAIGGSGAFYAINLPSNTYQLALAGANEDLNATGDLDVTSTVSLAPATGMSTIDGGDLDRVFDLHPGSTLAITDVVIRNGSVVGPGGGLRMITANFNATGCIIEDNITTTDGGGFFADTGVNISISQCEIRNNTADVDANGSNRGGAMYVADPGAGNTNSVTITYSTLAGNNGDAFGGAISTLGTATTTVTIQNSTISGNTTGLSGGGLSMGGPTFLDGVTIVGNTSNTTSATGGGGGIRNVNGVLTIRNTIVAGNEATLIDCDDISVSAGSVVTQGANLIGENTCTTTAFPAGAPNVNGDWVGTDPTPIDPFVGPLAENGGPTRTHALLVGSLAIDNGNTTLPLDQRLEPRDANPDIGSYEVGLPTAGSPQPGPGMDYVLSTVSPNPSAASARVTLLLDTPQEVRATLHDVAGRTVVRVFDGLLASGVEHELVVDGAGLSAGVYLLRVVGQRFEDTRTVVFR